MCPNCNRGLVIGTNELCPVCGGTGFIAPKQDIELVNQIADQNPEVEHVQEQAGGDAIAVQDPAPETLPDPAPADPTPAPEPVVDAPVEAPAVTVDSPVDPEQTSSGETISQ